MIIITAHPHKTSPPTLWFQFDKMYLQLRLLTSSKTFDIHSRSPLSSSISKAYTATWKNRRSLIKWNWHESSFNQTWAISLIYKFARFVFNPFLCVRFRFGRALAVPGGGRLKKGSLGLLGEKKALRFHLIADKRCFFALNIRQLRCSDSKRGAKSVTRAIPSITRRALGINFHLINSVSGGS